MPEWWTKYLGDIAKDEIVSLLTKEGFANPHAAQQWINEEAAHCRLSFASLVDTDERALSFSVPKEAIISCTQLGMSKGRPQTARWGFWTGYLLKQECSREKDLSSRFLAELIGILLGYGVRSEKVRTIFPELRREAEEQATSAARMFRENILKPDLSEKQFKRDLTSYIGKDLLPDSSMPPMIEQGTLSEDWVQNVIATRKAILRRIRKHDLLGGQNPIIRTSSLTRVVVNVPLNPLNPPVGSSSSEGGMIHLEKSNDVPIPLPVLRQEKSMSFSFTGDKDGGTTSIGFPQSSLDKQDPFAAALYAVPMWWFEWQAVFRKFERVINR